MVMSRFFVIWTPYYLLNSPFLELRELTSIEAPDSTIAFPNRFFVSIFHIFVNFIVNFIAIFIVLQFVFPFSRYCCGFCSKSRDLLSMDPRAAVKKSFTLVANVKIFIIYSIFNPFIF